jgi:lipid-binding SYLF domain-containing protein
MQSHQGSPSGAAESYFYEWGAPGLNGLTVGSVGFQIGAQATDLILLVLKEKGMESIPSSKAKLGSDAPLQGIPKVVMPLR